MTFVEFVENIEQTNLNLISANAIASFLFSINKYRNNPGEDSISVESLIIWVNDMAMKGLKPSTIKKYFSKLHTYFCEWKSAPGQDPFVELKRNHIPELNLNFDFLRDNLRIAVNLAFSAENNNTPEIRNIFLFLLYNVKLSLNETIYQTFNSEKPLTPQTDDIIEFYRKSTPRKKYLFGLNQGKEREKSIFNSLNRHLQEFLLNSGMTFRNSFSRDSITELWIYAALKAGVKISSLRSIVPSMPYAFRHLQYIPPDNISSEKQHDIINLVANHICDNSNQWFVMRMRRGVTPDDIENGIKVAMPRLYKHIILYYPTHKVLRSNNLKKRFFTEEPYLPATLFFKMKRNLVGKLFSKIGDLAWCYKWSNSNLSDYCTISQSEMKAFQTHLGQFSSDIKMEISVREIPFREGELVKIKGNGPLKGQYAIIQNIKIDNNSRTYTLRLTDRLEARWTLNNIEEPFLEHN